ncbi:MAG: hypothetical protein DRI57_06345 [Deltaproteobacteria bacterium]|nr:MAG: hypothetical protein DRI57_06345 [Deltaproteobacteria bacterium]
MDFFLTNLLFCVIPDKKCQEQVPNRVCWGCYLVTIAYDLLCRMHRRCIRCQSKLTGGNIYEKVS